MKNEYTIGTPDEDGSYKMWFGPCELTNCASQQGKSKDIIFHRIDDRMVPHSKWNGSKWIAIDFAEIKDSLIENIIIMLKVFNYQLKSKSHDDLILFFTHKDWRHGISIGVRVEGIDFIDKEEHDVRMAFTFSHDIIDVSTKEFGWNDRSKFSKYEKEILDVKRLVENKSKELKKIITLN